MMEQLLRKEVKSKKELVHILLTNDTEIRGNVRLASDCRLIDLLNSGEFNRPFIPVTEALVLSPQGKKLSLPFLAINANTIRSCFPIARKIH
jgi:hypothetical protein